MAKRMVLRGSFCHPQNFIATVGIVVLVLLPLAAPSSAVRRAAAEATTPPAEATTPPGEGAEDGAADRTAEGGGDASGVAEGGMEGGAEGSARAPTWPFGLGLPVHARPRAAGTEEAQAKSVSDKVYIVVMDDRPPLSEFVSNGDLSSSSSSSSLASFTSTSGAESGSDVPREWGSSSSSGNDGSGGSSTNSQRSAMSSAQARAYSASLASAHVSTLAAAGVRSTARIASVTYAINAFGAELTSEEAERLRSQPGVVSVERSTIYHPRVLYTPEYLRLPSAVWPAAGGRGGAGEGVIIGVLDTGIWPEHPSFSDKRGKPYGPPPAKWRGSCSTGPDFPATSCNRKLIGANFFKKGYEKEYGAITKEEYNSPRDANGHGTWCASAAGGNTVNMTYSGSFMGVGSGMAPRARIAAYKVCWWGSCSTLDIIMGLDKALADGVDIVSMSLGGVNDGFFGALEQALLRLAVKGVLIAAAAGNSGTRMTDQYAPWYMSVGASTIPSLTVRVVLGNGKLLKGRGFAPRKGNVRSTRLVSGASCAADGSAQGRDRARHCLAGSLSATRCRGTIVACMGGGGSNDVQKSRAVAKAGAAGFVFLSHPAVREILFGPYAVPGCMLEWGDSAAVDKLIGSTPRPTASINTGEPVMAVFSSRGPVVDPTIDGVRPTGPSPHTLKPDITAPGVDLLSAINSPNLASRFKARYDVMSGTSMSTSHIAGLAALVKQLRPTWSAAMIKSAMMTTATVRDDKGGPMKVESVLPPRFEAETLLPATPFSYGAGHVNPSRMLNPGLVYDAGQKDYYNFLAGLDQKKATQLPGVTFSSPPVPTRGFNLNQPYICVGRLRGSVVVTRRVTNVARATLVFSAVVERPVGVDVIVMPKQLPPLAPGASTTFTVTIRVLAPGPNYRFGSLKWVSRAGRHAVRSVIAVQPISK